MMSVGTQKRTNTLSYGFETLKINIELQYLNKVSGRFKTFWDGLSQAGRENSN